MQIMENEAEIYVIKSTVSPGTTEQLRIKTGKRIIFSPEYYGGTQHCNNFRFDFTILGGERKACIEVIQALQHVYDARHQFRITDSRTAELTKYMENSFLATKFPFASNSILSLLKDVDYEELRELFVLDPRVNPSHTFVDRLHPYWSSLAWIRMCQLLQTHMKLHYSRKLSSSMRIQRNVWGSSGEQRSRKG